MGLGTSSGVPQTLMNRGSLSVLIVDEEPLSRMGWARLLETSFDLPLMTEAGTPSEARQHCAEKRPALALVDVEMNGGEGCALVREFQKLSPGTKTVAFLRHCNIEWIQRALQAGALSCVSRRDPTSQLANAMSAALEGRAYLSSSAESLVVHEIAAGHLEMRRTAMDSLSVREHQVLALYGAGHSTQDVATALRMSVKTVETHTMHIREKLRLRSLGELRQLATANAKASQLSISSLDSLRGSPTLFQRQAERSAGI